MLRSLLVLLAGAVVSFGQSRRPDEYALVLADPPVAQMSHSRAELSGAAAQARLQAIRTAQSGVLAELRRRKVPVAAAVTVNGIVPPFDATSSSEAVVGSEAG